ncbi:hypothetical protein ACG0Z6_04850 [Roseateles sp. BYS180W]|uniref:Uncharacterized protein n=1 Tax=Roseateles rivi TaxID=3299028 RepID=A0ABW7FTE7_9BURK
MSHSPLTPDTAALEQALQDLGQQRYGQLDDAQARLEAAEAAADVEYLRLHRQCLQTRLDAALAAAESLSWMAPGARAAPAQALQRIRTLCELFPDLFSAMQAVAATHSGVPREMLSRAIQQFRPDAAAYSAEDLAGLLVAITNGGSQAFEAIMRTRKNAERKVGGGFPWGAA